MRRTMFVLPVPMVPMVQAACTDALVSGERKRTLAMLEQNGVPEADAHLRSLELTTLAAIETQGEATGAELSKLVPGLRRKLLVGVGTKWEGMIGLTTRVLFLLSTEQKIVRGRPKGGWTSSQYRWSPMSSWLPDAVTPPTADEARIDLAQRWLQAFGPATVADLTWWSGLTLGQVRKAVAALEVEDVDLEGVPGIVLAGDIELTPEPEPWVALLPSLDPTTMGLEAAELVPGRARGGAVRHQRQRRSHGLVRRSDRRRVGAAQDGRGRVPPAGGCRARGS